MAATGGAVARHSLFASRYRMFRRTSTGNNQLEWLIVRSPDTSEFQEIYESLKIRSQQRNLVIPKNIEKEFLKRIEACKKNDKKPKLDFSKMNIDDEMLELLIEIIEDYPIISKLVLANNPITNKSGLLILEILKNQLIDIQNIPLDRRLRSIFLSYIDLQNTKIDSSLVSQIHHYNEILAYCNAQSHLRDGYLTRNISDPIPMKSIHALWVSLYGSPPQKVNEYFQQVFDQAEKAHIKSVPYSQVEKQFLQCLVSLGELHGLSEQQRRELNTPIEAPAPQIAHEAKDDGDIDFPEELISNSKDRDDSVYVDNDDSTEDVMASKEDAVAEDPLIEVPLQSEEASSPTQDTSQISQLSNQLEADDNVETYPTVPSESSTAVDELRNRNHELETEVKRLKELIQDLRRREASDPRGRKESDASSMPPANTLLQDKVRSLKRSNDALKRKVENMRRKNDSLLALLNSMEVDRANAILASRGGDNTNELLDSVQISDDDVVEF